MFFPAQPGADVLPAAHPREVLPGLPWDRVLILMLLHTATAVVCIVLLTTLTRDPDQRRDVVSGARSI